jgi:hypothetical protein
VCKIVFNFFTQRLLAYQIKSYNYPAKFFLADTFPLCVWCFLEQVLIGLPAVSIAEKASKGLE